MKDLFSFSDCRQHATLFSITLLSLFHNMFRPHAAIFRCSFPDGTCCTAMPFLYSMLVFEPRGSASYVLVPSVVYNVQCVLCILFIMCYITVLCFVICSFMLALKYTHIFLCVSCAVLWPSWLCWSHSWKGFRKSTECVMSVCHASDGEQSMERI
jgi:hypothetical protein